MKYKDYYAILGVARDASDEDVKRAYRKLARKYHPDVSKERGAEDKFKEVAEAYETLKDPQKRAAYDRLGRHRPGAEFQPPPGWGREFGGGRTGGGFDFGDVDLSDLFADLAGMRGQGREGGPRSGRRARGARAGFSDFAGHDIEATATITLEQAAQGAELLLGDTGTRVRIPKGATHGDRLRIPGKGASFAEGGTPGDLYLNIAIEPHPLYRVDGHDLVLDLPIKPSEAVLGATIPVPTLDGEVELKLPAGARAGQRLRLGGKGLPRPRGAGSGDLYCVLVITPPAAPSEEERTLYQALAKAERYDPRAHLRRGRAAG